MDLTNQIIEKIYKRAGTKKVKRQFYVCKCIKCENIATMNKYDFKRWSGRCKKCARKLREYEALYNKFISKTQKNNIPNSISYEDFVKFAEKPYCTYCYTHVNFAKFHMEKKGYGYNLDRKNNSLEYSVDNCVVCCWRCNNSKSNRYSHEEWYLMNVSFREKNNNLQDSGSFNS